VTAEDAPTLEPPAPRRRATRTGRTRSAAAAFQAVVEERLRNLEQQLNEVKGRVNGLIFLIVGVVLTQVLLSLWQ
jgi:hypothetical protein